MNGFSRTHRRIVRRLQRLLTTATLVGLLIATAAAFAITEKLKLTKSAVYGTLVSHEPLPDLRLRARPREDLLQAAPSRRHHRLGPERQRTGGRAARGAALSSRPAHAHVERPRRRRPCAFPTAPTASRSICPASTRRSTSRTASSSTRSRRSVRLRCCRTASRSRRIRTIRPTSFASPTSLSKPAHLVAYLDGARVLYSQAHAKGSVLWYGTGPSGPLAPGAYTLELGAVDLNGNTHARGVTRARACRRSATSRSRTRGSSRAPGARSRSACRPTRSATPGSSVGGTASPRRPLLRLQAPTTRGRYTLTVSEHGHVEPSGGVRAVIGLAHLGGPIACLGLALLLVAKTQRERIAGLGFGVFGTCVLGAAVAPHRPLELLGGFFGALGIGLGLALAFRRLPWLFPVLALASVPVRIGVHVGQSSTKLLVPLYIVILGAAILLAWDLIERDRPRARAARRGVAARGLPRLGRALDLVEPRRERGRGRAARVLCPVHAARDLRRAPAVEHASGCARSTSRSP